MSTRASDIKLAADLRDAGLEELAVRAEESEFNDYFGKSAAPQHDLIGWLQSAAATAPHDRRERINAMIKGAMRGDYDATREEAAEWGTTPEGQQGVAALRKLGLVE